MRVSAVTAGLIVLLVAALVMLNAFFNTLLATVQSARTSVGWILQRARLAALTDVPAAWRKVAMPSTGKAPKALLVMLHGLQGHPIQFEHMRVRADPEWAVYLPFIHRLGDDHLEHVLSPLQKVLRRFIDAHSQSIPIILVGVSNGARLCGALEVWLRTVVSNPVLVSAIAGPFRGTKTVQTIGKLAVSMGMVGAPVMNELRFDGPSSKKLVQAMAAPTELKRQFFFYATRQDTLVAPVETCTPIIGQNERSIVVEGYDHASIVLAVAQHQFRTIREFCKSANYL